MFTLLKNTNLYNPQKVGKTDILIGQGKILAIDPDLNVAGLPSVSTIDCRGKLVTPGLIDQHVHLIGGGGESGFASRVPQVTLKKLLQAGTTTVIGVLGTDGISRSPRDLYAKAAALTESGMSAYMYTGSYEVPTKTITGSIRDDIAFIPSVLGVKVALADHRCSFPTTQELARITSDIRVAGLLSGKRGVLHIHMGDLPNAFDKIDELLDMGIPIQHFSPTHLERNAGLFDEAISFALKGGKIDITSAPGNYAPQDQMIKHALESGVAADRITTSSDGNGSLPEFNEQGELTGIVAASCDSNLEFLPKLINVGIEPEQAIAMMTANVADTLGINKGRIETGHDADICIFNDDFTIHSVIAKGKAMILGGDVLIKENFE